MLDGMPAVRVKAEPLESEKGVRERPPPHPEHSFFFSCFPCCCSFSQRWADNHSQAFASEYEWGGYGGVVHGAK